MRHHYLRPLLGTPGFAAGALVTAAAVYGLWKGAPVNAESMGWLAGALFLLLSKRGISVHPSSGEIRLWYGLGFTRFLVLPVWPRRRRAFRSILLRMIHHPSPNGGLGTRQPAVWLLDAQDRWLLVAMAGSHDGAVRIAERLSRQTGLPIG